MIKYFYKYTPLREEFFHNLMIRATPFCALNDPYEGLFNKTQLLTALKQVDRFYEQHGSKPTKENNQTDLDDLMGEFLCDFQDVGVLSFSEDNTNPLMWSHYADEHRGIVIEFDYDKPLFQDSIYSDSERKSRFKKDYFGDVYEQPESVMYRREMPSFMREKLIQPDNERDWPWKKFNYSIFFTKSNDWIYEKELRSIIPLNSADRIICIKDKINYKIIKDIHKIHSEIDIEELNNKIIITYPNEYEMHEDMADKSIRNELYIDSSFNKKDNIYLFRINPESITGIYCGCRCDYNKVKSLVNSNPLLVHLKNNIYYMDIDSRNYQLNPININSNEKKEKYSNQQ